MSTSLSHLIDSQPVIVADGGMGTMLFAQGLQRGSSPELWNTDRPDAVRRVHAAYIAAGSQIILTNSFGGNRARLVSHGLAERAAELNRAAAQNARAEADGAAHAVVVAGSIGPTGGMLAPLGDLEYADVAAMFAEQSAALVEGGVDILWIETMSDLAEVHAAVEGCRQSSPETPIVVTMTFDTRGRTMMGITPEGAAQALDSMGLIAFGANCGNGPDELEATIERMHAAVPSAVLVAKANAGLPRMVGTEAVYDATPDVMADYARRVTAKGARIVGACCGSTPDHIRAIAGAVSNIPV